MSLYCVNHPGRLSEGTSAVLDLLLITIQYQLKGIYQQHNLKYQIVDFKLLAPVSSTVSTVYYQLILNKSNQVPTASLKHIIRCKFYIQILTAMVVSPSHILGLLLLFEVAFAQGIINGGIVGVNAPEPRSRAVLQPETPIRVLTRSDPKTGVLNNTKLIYNQDPASKYPVFTDTKYVEKGNIRNTTFTRYYQTRVILSVEELCAKIDPTIPESYELQPSVGVAPPYNGIIFNPRYFNQWDNLATAIVNQINLARTNPYEYAKYVEEQLGTFTNDRVFRQGQYLTTSTEGKPAWLQAIQFLRYTQKPVPTLRRVQCLDQSAKMMVDDAQNNKVLGHVDSKGRAPFERMKQTCRIDSGGESISYGYMSARMAVLQLIVDDSTKNRTHRNTLFSNYTQIGVAAGPFPEYLDMVVIDYLY